MLRRSLVLSLCISLVGVSALPASAIPCCCTYKQAKVTRQWACPNCAPHDTKVIAGTSLPSIPPCCAKKSSVSVPTASCCSTTLVEHLSGKCRCHDLMQMIALTACSSCHSVMGTAPLVEQSVDTGVVTASRRGQPAGLETRFPETVVFLRTCSLLI